MTVQDNSGDSGKIGHNLATTAKGSKSGKRASKTTAGYWLHHVELLKRSSKGTEYVDAEYSCRIHWKGRRERFQLRTGYKEEAARRAAERYRDVIGRGWEEALRIHEPEEVRPPQAARASVTVGEAIEVASGLSGARPESKLAYASALRRIASAVSGITDGNRDPRPEARAAWKARVDAIPLESLTPSRVLAWKNKYLDASGDRESAAVTVNALLRNAKALFSRKVRPFLERELVLPSPLFFEGIEPEREPSLRYRSRVDAEEILRAAQAELATTNREAFKLLLLVLVFGLRRSEADRLLWSQFDFSRGVLRIEDTAEHRLKTPESAGDLDVEPEIAAIFRGFRILAGGPFVLEEPSAVRHRSTWRGGPQVRRYRCEPTHRALLAWLKAKGVTGKRPIHTMRKEIGARIASRDGIFAASRYLRHADIQITSRLYADKKAPVLAGLGAILGECGPNVVRADFGATRAESNAGGELGELGG